MSRHRYLEMHAFEALTSGHWNRLEKFGALAERVMISDDVRSDQKIASKSLSVRISVIAPLCNTSPFFLAEMIFSIKEQTYQNWELYLVDANDDKHGEAGRIARFFANQDGRIHYRKLDSTGGISDSANDALEMARGDCIALCDHDDILHPSALFVAANAIEKEGADFVYTDECAFDSDNGYLLQSVSYKPDYAPDTFRGANFIGHLTVFRRTLLEKAGGGFRSEYAGCQDYDLALRLIEQASGIVHIPRILYFDRVHGKVTTSDRMAPVNSGENKGALVVQESLKRLGLPGTVESLRDFPGFYRIRYKIKRPGKVSIIIPTKNHVDDLRKCISSILEKTTWPDYEILVVDNGSTDPELRDYYTRVSIRSDVRILHYDKPFNYSKINNFAAEQASGMYCLFLNNDTEVISPGWIEEMMMYAQRPDIGAVGAKLYYFNGTIQHAGVIVGLGGVAGHVFCCEPHMTSGYMGHAIIAVNYSAVTAACVMVRTEVFREVGGFDESFAVAFNDVDLCLRILSRGYRNVWTPHAELYHYESKSRSYDYTPEKQMRLKDEGGRFVSRWKDFLTRGDPAYNPNLSLSVVAFTEKKHDL